MPTNLDSVRDHPANLLMAFEPGIAHGFVGAAGHLLDYEADKGVTFAALDNEALATVREDFAAVCANVNSPQMPNEVRNLIDSVRDLLGLT